MKLVNYIEFKNGKKKPNENGNIPIYGGNGILGYTNKSNTKKNNLVIGRVGAYCGCVYKSDEECWISDNAILGIVRHNVDYNFMYYLLKSLCLNNHHIGSSQPLMTQEILNNLEVDIPNYDIQVKIGKILLKFDKKIELNNQMNDNLQEIIKNVYKEKFINNLKSSSMKMNELVATTIGGDWGKEELTDNYNSEVLCIRGADIPEMDNGNKGKAPNRFILEKNLKVKQLHGEEIIIEISGGSPTQSTGRCAYITHELKNAFDKPLICTNFCRAIKLRDNKYLPSFYMNLKYLYSKNIMFLYENGTTGIKNLDLASLMENEDISIINDNLMNEFNELFYTINKKMIQNADENRTLGQLRDTLLPKLINGAINLDKIEI